MTNKLPFLSFNDTFRRLLTDYGLPEDLSFAVNLPREVQEIVDSTILVSEFGVTLDVFNNLFVARNLSESPPFIEDNENHFHVDSYFEPTEDKQAFMLGVKTLLILAEKFQHEEVSGVRFYYSFQTPELGKEEAIANNLHEDTDEYFISDRLSFFTRREAEPVVTSELFVSRFYAVLTIDI